MRFGVYGGSGRVGRLLIENIQNDSALTLSAVHVYDGVDLNLDEGVLVTNDIATLLENCDAVIDFTLPDGTEALLEEALKNPTAIVSGTTGLTPHQQNLMKEASKTMPILYATNMSVGVAVLKNLVYKASKIMHDFDIEIVEMHHKYKKDAPSGTALTLAEFAAKGRELDLDAVRVSGRNGNIGERTKDEIGVMSLRGGDIVGRHTVGFYNEGEYIELNHTATSRDTFAKGAIRAGKWLILQESGLYSIDDALEL